MSLPPHQPSLIDPGSTYIFNHVHLILAYHKGTPGNAFTDGRIVRAQVQLASCETYPCPANPKGMKIPDKIPDNFKIVYSYSVQFVVSGSVRERGRRGRGCDNVMVVSPVGEGGHSLGVTLGLHPELDASEQRAVVQPHQLHSHNHLPLCHGRHDPPPLTPS